ncbi:hypothetical protein PRIC1_014265 [Phytophthora ramorum]
MVTTNKAISNHNPSQINTHHFGEGRPCPSPPSNIFEDFTGDDGGRDGLLLGGERHDCLLPGRAAPPTTMSCWTTARHDDELLADGARDGHDCLLLDVLDIGDGDVLLGAVDHYCLLLDSATSMAT